MDNLNIEHRKVLHGQDYVDKFDKEQSDQRIRRLLKYIELSKEYVVADFACGNGMLLDHIHEKVEKYIGVDFSEPFITSANRRMKNKGIKNANFICSSIEEFCGTHNNMFDAGFALDFSEHVYDNEWVDILSNIHDTLKSDGTLYVHTPNKEFILEIMKENNLILKQFKEHVAVRDVPHNIKLLTQAGFSDITVKCLSHYNALRYLHIFSISPFIGKYFKARIFITAKKI